MDQQDWEDIIADEKTAYQMKTGKNILHYLKRQITINCEQNIRLLFDLENKIFWETVGHEDNFTIQRIISAIERRQKSD